MRNRNHRSPCPHRLRQVCGDRGSQLAGSVSHILEAIKSNPVLEELDITGNVMGDEVCGQRVGGGGMVLWGCWRVWCFRVGSLFPLSPSSLVPRCGRVVLNEPLWLPGAHPFVSVRQGCSVLAQVIAQNMSLRMVVWDKNATTLTGWQSILTAMREVITEIFCFV